MSELGWQIAPAMSTGTSISLVGDDTALNIIAHRQRQPQPSASNQRLTISQELKLAGNRGTRGWDMKDIESSTQISPCLRIFIESLLDEADDGHVMLRGWITSPRESQEIRAKHSDVGTAG